MWHKCRTSKISDLAAQGSVRKRSRACASQNRAAGFEEAAALLWMRTREITAEEDTLSEGIRRVEELLQLDAAGVSPCGVCIKCEGGSYSECIRVSNRRLMDAGSLGAKWAEEASQLKGKRFQVRTLHFAVVHVFK